MSQIFGQRNVNLLNAEHANKINVLVAIHKMYQNIIFMTKTIKYVFEIVPLDPIWLCKIVCLVLINAFNVGEQPQRVLNVNKGSFWIQLEITVLKIVLRDILQINNLEFVTNVFPHV